MIGKGSTGIAKMSLGDVEIQRGSLGDKEVFSKLDLGPGPQTLIGGDMQAGFFGETPVSELITGDELAALIGLTKGSRQYSNEPWLKFAYMGNVEFVAKKPFRYNISWNDINAVNAVFGDRIETINGRRYKIRLMKGKTEGKQDDVSANNGAINHGSEWNKLMLPIHVNAPSGWKYPKNVNSPTENWGVGYTDADLVTNSSHGNGSYSWCQEYGGSASTRLYRGRFCVSGSNNNSPSNPGSNYGWRPVLELIQE